MCTVAHPVSGTIPEASHVLAESWNPGRVGLSLYTDILSYSQQILTGYLLSARYFARPWDTGEN